MVFNIVCGTEADAGRWARVVMGLNRRLSTTDFSNPPRYVVVITFAVPGRYIEADGEGVTAVKARRRARLVEVRAVLDAACPPDPVPPVLAMVERAVDAAAGELRRKRWADDVPEARVALALLRELGPAPVHPPDARLGPMPGGDSTVLPRMVAASGALAGDPTVRTFSAMLDDVATGVEAWTRIYRGDGAGELEVTRVGESFHLERSDGGDAPRFAARSDDPDVVIRAVREWLDRGPASTFPTWQPI